MPSPVAAGIGVATGLAQTIVGAVNAGKLKKEAARIAKQRPEYEISQLAGQDLDLAESELMSGGLSSRAETAYNNLDNQQFASSLGAILRGGGSGNNVATLYGNNQEGRTRLALLNDQLRSQQIDRLMKTRSMYRDEQDKEWQINDFAPWKDKQRANAEARGQAQKQLWSGITTAANAGINYFGGRAQEKLYDKYFGNGGTYSASQNPYSVPHQSNTMGNMGYDSTAGRTPGFNPNVDMIDESVGIQDPYGSFEMFDSNITLDPDSFKYGGGFF